MRVGSAHARAERAICTPARAGETPLRERGGRVEECRRMREQTTHDSRSCD